MPEKSSSRSSFLHFLLTFAIVYLLTTTGMRLLFPSRFQREPENLPPVSILVQKRPYIADRNLFVRIQNNTEEVILLPDSCPKPPVIIERKGESDLSPIDLSSPVIPCKPFTEIPAKNIVQLDLSPWKYALIEPATYRISLSIESMEGGDDIPIASEIRVKQAGLFTSSFRAFISKPLLNSLVLLASILPGHSLALSIMLLTIIIKLLLFLPSQHALESQKRLQSIQPKIEAIKRKHLGDQKRITEETMQLWKTEKINPLQSCLPTLVQIPILIGLFFIIRDSGTLPLAAHLLYSPLQHIDWTFTTTLFGIIDLNAIPYEGFVFSLSPEPWGIVLRGAPFPVLVGALQFIQMRMTMKKAAKGKSTDKNIPLADRLDPQTMMMYMLPIMIIFISGSMPLAVSFYWVTSTLFAIGQQYVVNRRGKN